MLSYKSNKSSLSNSRTNSVENSVEEIKRKKRKVRIIDEDRTKYESTVVVDDLNENAFDVFSAIDVNFIEKIDLEEKIEDFPMINYIGNKINIVW